MRLARMLLGAALLALIPISADAADLWRQKGAPAFVDANGDVYAGAQFCYFDAATSNARTVYKDSAETTPWSQPIVLDAAGKLSSPIYVPTGAFKEEFRAADATTCSDGTVIFNDDNIPGALDTSGLSASFAKPDMPVIAKATNYTVTTSDLGSVFAVTATGGAVTITLPSAATAGDGAIVAVKKIDASANAVTIDTTGGQTIDGSASKSLSTQYGQRTVVSDGANWHAIDTVEGDQIGAGTVDTTQLASNAVTSIKIATNAVTSSAIATGAVGTSEIATNGVGSLEIATDAVGSDEIAANAVGSSEIASNSVGASEYSSSAYPGWIRLANGTSTGSTVNIDLSSHSGYEAYKILVRLRPTNDTDALYLRTSSDGSSFDSAASDYAWILDSLAVSAATSTLTSDTADSEIELFAATSNNTSEGVSCEITLSDPDTATLEHALHFLCDGFSGSNTPAASQGSGWRLGTGDIDGFQFSFSVGSVASITWAVYGAT
jgi:hypothetical protein